MLKRANEKTKLSTSANTLLALTTQTDGAVFMSLITHRDRGSLAFGLVLIDVLMAAFQRTESSRWRAVQIVLKRSVIVLLFWGQVRSTAIL